ncbi:MAG: flagellar export chaperone FliS [Clostridiaceae bacterium]|nr:flagellar export chaperone FliS [Eubacteriales bacterium]
MYAKPNPQDAYRQQGILTANPVELIVMLYDGCIKQLKLGCLALDDKNYEKSNVSFQKAQRIIMELITSLDFRYELAHDLMRLYEFMLEQIVEGNLKKEKAPVLGTMELLEELRGAWAQVSKSGAASVAVAE